MTIRFADLDDVELIQDIEQSFAIKLPDQETVDCRTFGDLFDCVAKRVPHSRLGACLSARAFRRLRAALGDRAPDGTRFRPSTRIAELVPGLIRLGGLQRASDLAIANSPTVAVAPFAYLWWLGVFAVPALAALFHVAGLNDKSAIAVSFIVFLFIAAASSACLRRVDPSLTVADLIRANAPYNLGALGDPAKPIRTADLWSSLEAITRTHTGYTGPIDRRTRFEHVWQ